MVNYMVQHMMVNWLYGHMIFFVILYGYNDGELVIWLFGLFHYIPITSNL